MKSQTFAQVKSDADLMQAAHKSFSGDDLTKKNGPLAKAGFDLALLVEEYKNYAITQSFTPFKPSNSLLQVIDDRVVVDIVAGDDPAVLVPELMKAGMQITGIAGPIISGLIPITSIELIAGLQDVRFFHPAMCSTNVGLTTSQGDVAQRSAIVKTTLGYNGTGVTVGVLSDSYNYLGGALTDVSTDDLPGAGNPNGFTTPVNVLADNGTTDEGRAMLQIIHDVAPGAFLAFATAFTGQAGFANNITNLWTTAGADVIVDDVFYYFEPMFQDGKIAQAVDAAVAAGVPYFSAAGNQAKQSYESVWRSGPPLNSGAIPGGFYGGTTFDFDPGAGVDNMQSFTLGNGQYILIVLQWDSPFTSVCTGCPGSSNDLDIYVLNAAGNQVLASSAYNNIGGDAVEGFQFINTTGSTATFNIMITNYFSPNPGLLKYINFGYTQGGLQYATNSSTIYGHANAAGAEAVAAATYYETPEFGVDPALLEYFSSYGPTAIHFTTTGAPTSDPRSDKPEITAPDGVNTTFFGYDIDGDTYPNFFGTSAAAPHAAAVAALMLDANGSLTPVEIYAGLEAGAINMGPPGFDNGSGFGLIQADNSDPLPVELVSFKTSEVKDVVDLKWKTATEIKNAGFEIERTSTALGMKWENIGFVKGSGNSSSPKEYSYKDKSPKFGKYQYRLKQINTDGTFEYSKTVEVTINRTLNLFAKNYPNPFNPTTKIIFELPNRTNVNLSVYNLIGQKVATLVDEQLEQGVYERNFNAVNLTTGIYFYTLNTDESSITNKLLLIK
jgi:hypothetical protein